MEWLEENDEDAYVALLLSSLPNLERLDLVASPRTSKCFETSVQKVVKMERVFHTHQVFASLRAVVNDCNDALIGTSAIDMI